MSQIGDTEHALLDVLKSCQLPAGISIESAPNEWTGNFVTKLVSETPALRLVFGGATPRAGSELSTSLNMTARWSCLVVTGWHGLPEDQNRLAEDGGYDLVARVAPIVHNAPLVDPVNQRLPIPYVTSIENVSNAALLEAGLWVCEIQVEVELPLDIPEDCVGPLDDFLRVRGPISVSDSAEDIEQAIDLPQT